MQHNLVGQDVTLDRGDTDIHCTSRYCTYFGDVWSEFHDFMNDQIFWTKNHLVTWGHLAGSFADLSIRILSFVQVLSEFRSWDMAWRWTLLAWSQSHTKPRKLAVAVDSLARHSWYMLVWQDYFQNFQSWTFQSHDSHEFQALWILGGIKFHLCFAAVAA